MLHLTHPQKLIYDMEKFSGGAISVICGSMIYRCRKDISEMKKAINELFWLNDALRIRIREINGTAFQYVEDFQEKEIEVLSFKDKAELDDYASAYAKKSIDMFGSLCEIKLIELDDGCGLICKLHHLIGDAWTLSLIGSQFNKILNGEAPECYSYCDYISAEEKYINGKRYVKDSEFFVEQFKKCNEVTFINEKQAKSMLTDRKTFVIDKNKTKAITEYAQRNNSSVFTLLLTALSVYINRTKMNVEKFYIGTAVLNRLNAKEKNTMGMFINTVPVLIELNNDNAFSANAESVQDSVFSVLRHQKYNYGDILDELRRNFNLGEKLYDIMLSYQNAKITDSDDSFESTWYHCGMQTESLQIHIDDRDNEGILTIHYDYLTEKFSEHNIELLHEHIFNILFDAIENDGKKIYELNILTEDEKQKLLYDFNDTAVDYPKDKCVHELFEEQAAKMPDKTAVTACDRTLTYVELNEQANKIAHSLIEKGVGIGDIVALALPRKSYLISIIIGILKCGAAYLPIDINYPQDRIEYMLSDSNAKLFITERDTLQLLENSDKSKPYVSMNSENLFCCIYTSGSTGTPKGALLNHRNFNNHFLKNVYNKSLQQYKSGLCLANVVFDMFINETFSVLLFGLELVLVSDKDMISVEHLAQTILQNNIDFIICTPSKFSAYLDNDKFRSSIYRVKMLIFGGEVLSPEFCDRIATCTKAEIINGYGPTETTIVSTYGNVSDGDITIGKPVANTQIYIVDQYMQTTPIGITGELCIAGDGVGIGYLNRPELTAEKFIDNPFGNGKLYKTGDLAYWREDGNIAYIGRSDFQVKIRGLRIELGEIENAICSIDDISQAVVVVRKNNESRQLICAFYTGKEIDSKEIRTQIGKKLPKYMLPHIFTHLNEMPLTTSGKINRKALPQVDLYAVDTAVEYIAPQTEQEAVLVSAIESVLKIGKVSILDNFFDLGGDSLKAIELIAKIEKHGYHTDTKTIFDCDTVKELAEQLTVEETLEEVFDYTGDIPATPAQMRVYTSQSIKTDSTTYNVPYLFKVKTLDADKLQQAINSLVARHEILRTYFENKDGSIIQVVDYSATCNVEKLESDDILAFVRPFNLSKAPLIRVGCYENTMMIDMHHIITDGGSMPVFLHELNELYMGITLDTEPVQYKRFAVQKQDYSESEKYWLSVYSDELPELTINTDFKRGQKQSFNGNAIYDTIDIELHHKIIAFCKENNLTPYVFYMAGFNILLSKFSGCEDIVVGMPISGREGKFLDTIGMFVNTIALRNKPVGTKSVTDFLQEVKENSIAAIAHQDYPFGDLVKKLGLNTADRNPLFDVMFAYQSEQMTAVVFGDKKAELLPIPVTTSKYDFTFNIMPRDKDVVVMVEYCTDLYKQAKIQKFIDSFKLILEQALNETMLIKDMSAVGEAEKQKLLYDFNDTAIDYQKDKCVHELFEEQAAKTPDKTAVIAGDKDLTYSELNEQANRIAYVLLEKGVGVGDIIAIILTRKSYLLSAMFGVLKTGAAYMPIDPDYPQDRIDYMLTEGKVKYVIDESNIADLLSNANTQNPEVSIDGNDIFCALHTSGSTGTPKMSLLKHSSIINFITANKKFWRDIDTVVSATIVTFDAFQMDSVLSIAQGYRLVLASEDEIYNQSNFESLFRHSDRNMFFSTPTKIENYIDNSNDKTYLQRIKSFVVGGEVFGETLLSKISTYSPDSQVFNIYGPTETTICTVVDELESDKEITIGKPIANNQIYIVDKYMQPTPIGVTGELCIAGDGVGVGYLNRPELTAEKFVDNPFGEGKLYKTGDLAYWREDGNIVYVGRNDFQVKIRGLRIELGEIENAISSVDGIMQSVAVVRKNETGRQLICAFYTGDEIDAKEIRSYIGTKLPKYMLPHIFSHLDEMPLTTSGKINRKALPEIVLENIANYTDYVTPKTNRQKELCRLMETVLGMLPVSITDDFFDLGGDSLKAIEFVSKAHSEGIYFNLQNIFDYPTVQKLCDYIESGDKQDFSFADVDFTEVNRILAKNTLENMTVPQKTEVGNILLAGATGFLGIHILADFLDHDTGTAYCLVRGKDKESSTRRLQELLSFYFGDKYSELNRIEVVCADLQKDKFSLSNEDYTVLFKKIDTVINCAASVKHYGSYKYFYEANVETTKRLIEFCKAANAKLIHTSTLSVSGNSFGDDFDGYISETEKHFYESSLYVGQPLENVYARSKFEAEKAVLDAMTDGLQANIMRMGNLTNRLSDGMFQKNHESNAFLNRIKSVLELGCVPEYLLDIYLEFTPIDEAANAVMTITRHFSTEQTVFHINSTKVVYLDRLLEYFNILGYPLKVVGCAEFTDALRQTAKQTGMDHIFATFINDMDENDHLNYDSNIRIENAFTEQYLKMFGFEWSNIEIDYLRKYVEYFKKIGYLK